MSYWNSIREWVLRIRKTTTVRTLIRSPVAQIIALNTAMFILWRSRGVTKSFMAKHFAFERSNINQNRFHTLFTYAFSHYGFLNYLLNMAIIGSFGKAISRQFGNKIVWILYLAGAGMGGLLMHWGMPYVPTVIPQVGADAAVTAMMTFYGFFNMHQTVMIFVFPVRMWVFLGFLGVYCMIEPSKKALGGALAGLLIYQLFKIKLI